MSTNGKKTSEHKAMWSVILTSLAAGIAAVVMLPTMPVAIVVVGTLASASLASAGYSVSRGLAKNGTQADPPVTKP